MTAYYTPAYALRKDYMEPLKLTVDDLAKHMDIKPKVLQQFLNGETELTADLAIRLGRTFGTSAHKWINIDFHSKVSLNWNSYSQIKSLWTE